MKYQIGDRLISPIIRKNNTYSFGRIVGITGREYRITWDHIGHPCYYTEDLLEGLYEPVKVCTK